MELDNNNEQPLDENSTVTDNQPETKTYTVNGKDMTPEQVIESYNNLQSEFTKKSQKLSEYEKQGTESNEIKEKADLIEKSEKIKEEEGVFNDFKSDFTTLSEHQFKTVRDLQAINPDKSFEEIAKSYGMLDEAQIERSKNNRAIMGNNIGVKSNKTEEVTISEHARKIHNLKTPAEREIIMKKMGL